MPVPPAVQAAIDAYQGDVDQLAALQSDLDSKNMQLANAQAAQQSAQSALTAGHATAATDLQTLIGLLTSELPPS